MKPWRCRLFGHKWGWGHVYRDCQRHRCPGYLLASFVACLESGGWLCMKTGAIPVRPVYASDGEIADA